MANVAWKKNLAGSRKTGGVLFPLPSPNLTKSHCCTRAQIPVSSNLFYCFFSQWIPGWVHGIPIFPAKTRQFAARTFPLRLSNQAVQGEVRSILTDKEGQTPNRIMPMASSTASTNITNQVCMTDDPQLFFQHSLYNLRPSWTCPNISFNCLTWESMQKKTNRKWG